jgi:hypothetical protein
MSPVVGPKPFAVGRLSLAGSPLLSSLHLILAAR